MAPRFSTVLALMVLAGSVSIMSTDLFAPSLPHLAQFFASSPDIVQLTISLNLVVYGFAQLLFGPLCDRFGRRPVFLCSLVLFSLASIGCAMSRDIDQLIMARILQGFFASAEAVVCLAVFKDLFTEQEQAKGFAIYGMAVAVTPGVAPIIGGYVHVLLGWEFNFYLTASAGLLVATMIFLLLPETTTPDHRALRPREVARNYYAVFSNRTFMVYACLAGVALGLIFIFITAGPFILIDYFGVATQHYGYYQAAIVVTFFLGSSLATRLVDRWRAIHVLNLGVGFIMIGSVLLLLLVFSGSLTGYNLTFAFMLISMGEGPIFAVATAKAMSAVQRAAGSAAATFGSLEIGMSGAIAALVSVFHDGTILPFGYVTGLTATMVLLLALVANRINARIGLVSA